MTKHFAIALLVFPLLLSCGKTKECINYDDIDPGLVCTADYNPVCGCDNYTYRNECYAKKSGVIQWIGGPCP